MPEALKIFPLPSSVLFPGCALPLLIFEPRYRDLVRDALASDGVMALGSLQPGWEGRYEGRPPLATLCTMGVIGWHEELADGRYEIVLEGRVRARVLEELPPHRTYREVRAELLPDPQGSERDEEPLRQALLELAARLAPPSAQSLLSLAAQHRGQRLVDVLAGTLVEPLAEQQALLAELDPARRAHRMLGLVTEILLRLPPAGPTGPMN